jgi:hypothetical protein
MTPTKATHTPGHNHSIYAQHPELKPTAKELLAAKKSAHATFMKLWEKLSRKPKTK